MSDDLPLLSELMPWSTGPLRPGRGWPMAPDAASLTARWDRLVRAGTATATGGETKARTSARSGPGAAADTGAGDAARIGDRDPTGDADEAWDRNGRTGAGAGGRNRNDRTGSGDKAGHGDRAARGGEARHGGEATREALFRPTRSRTLHSTVSQLPGHPAATTPLAREAGHCPEPVRVLHGTFDQQWLIPDHRLLDTARPELWRVADAQQIFTVAHDGYPRSDLPGPGLVPSAVLPDGWSPAGRRTRIRPFYRRPGGQEPNLAPGLLDHLSDVLGQPVGAEDFLAWVVAVAHRSPGGCAVPLTDSPALWDEGVALGRRALWLHTRGARGVPGPGQVADRPRMPGGLRPYVRAALPTDRLPLPEDLGYDPDDAGLLIGQGRIAPVSRGAWEFAVDGVPVLRTWFERRTGPREPGTLEAVRPAAWPREWTSDLLELITVLSLLAELRPEQRRLVDRLAGQRKGARPAGGAGGAVSRVGATGLRRAGVLPPPDSARRPSSVLDHEEEGPGGQFTLL